ncbi:MAG: glycosyltransferase [Kineosporiaceae bacterium]|nr:glycosyltransferase [Kineosporiaceae bacterium]
MRESGQVFFDPTGSRWTRVRRVSVGLAVLVVATLALGAPSTLTRPGTASVPVSMADPLPDLPAQPAILGSGPLVRLVRLEPAPPAPGAPATLGTQGRPGGLIARDPSTGARVATLSSAEVAQVGSGTVALQRYGRERSGSPVMTLTFDDGPNPTWTPPLLDLLSRHRVPATFFVVGSAVVAHPEITRRAVREGHEVAGHSMTHADLNAVSGVRGRWEFVWTERLVRAATGRQSSLFRLPYEGDDEESLRGDVRGIWRAQQLGFHVATQDADSNDWRYGAADQPASMPLPDLDGRDLTVLLHDSGGDRRATIAYVDRLIRAARDRGYTFATMSQAQAAVVAAPREARPDRWDRVAWIVATAVLRLPRMALTALLLLAGGSMALGLVNSAIALARHRRRRRIDPPSPEQIARSVSVVIAAYNEERVIERTVRSVLASDYPLRELIVVDDGSTDATLVILNRLARSESRLLVLRQPNGGKASALNRGIGRARGSVIVTMDADTLIAPDTVTRLAAHFAADVDGRLGAVAGVVRVGNRTTNLLTRWQALEYVSQIGVERAAQDAMGAITIVPGACAAWSRRAVLAVGGFSDQTLAEDCDLSLSLHRAGWRVTQDDRALAYTEVPEDVDSLLAQRTRWTFGTLQAIAKHRSLMFSGNGWLGWFVLPLYVSSIVVPLLFLPLTTASAIMMIHRQGWGTVGLYLAGFLLAQAAIAAVAIRVLGERWSLVLMVPVYRFAFEPLRAYLLYTCAAMALRGVHGRWNKIARTGSVTEPS